MAWISYNLAYSKIAGNAYGWSIQVILFLSINKMILKLLVLI